MSEAGTALAVALTAALAVLFVVLLAALLVRRCWRPRDGVASRGGFVLFDVCFHDDRRRQATRPSLGRSRGREPAEHAPGEATEEHQEPGESELARWKKMFRATTRSLSTIDEGTEKSATPAFCTPPASPDRRDARALDTASVAVQVKI